ncbi:hypothetical protein BGW42_004071 [Actinomortierella wolfii]|nr:hypothetical protein BGW42_004071 [Actinomortierella wolfii]
MQLPGAFPEENHPPLNENHYPRVETHGTGTTAAACSISAAPAATAGTVEAKVMPSQSRALELPEIVALIGQHLDRPSLARALRVCRLWHRSLVPVMWSALTIDASHRRYRSSTLFEQWLDLLEPNVHFTRSLAVLSHRSLDDPDIRDTGTSSSTIPFINPDDHLFHNTHHTNTTDASHFDGDGDDELLSPLQIIVRILSLRHATNLQSITFQTTEPVYSILLSAQRIVSLERLDFQTAGGGPSPLYLSDAFYAYPHLRHLRFAPLSSSSPSSSSFTFMSTARGSEIQTTLGLHQSRYLALQTLDLHNVSWPAKDLLTFAACCPELRMLAIRGRAKVPWDWTVETIQKLAELCPKLEALHLHPRFGTEVAEPLLVCALECLPQLRKLEIPNCHFGTALFDLLMDDSCGTSGGTGASTKHGGSGDDGGHARGTKIEDRAQRRIERLSSLNVSYTRMPASTSWSSLVSTLTGLTMTSTSPPPSLPLSSVPSISSTFSPPPPPTQLTWACKNLTTLKIGFAMFGGDLSITRVIYRHLAQFEALEHLCITPSHVPIRLGHDDSQGPLLELLATLRKLRVFDSHGTRGDMRDRRVVQWMARHWPKLMTLQVFLGGGEENGEDGGSEAAELQKDQHRQLVMQWFAEEGRYVQVLAA